MNNTSNTDVLRKEDSNFIKFSYINTTCYICGNNHEETVYEVDRYKEGKLTFVRCKNDGLLYQNPRPDDASLNAFFNSSSFSSKKNTEDAEELTGYYDYLSGEAFRAKMAKDRYKLLKKFKPANEPLDILKIAPGTGSFLKEAKDNGNNVLGVDVSEFFVKYAKEKHGIEMVLANFEDVDLGDRKFDVILLFGAISNISKPKFVLEKILTLLKPDGHLHVNIIDEQNLVCKIQKSNHFLIRPPVIALFNNNNFKQLLKMIGYEVIYNKQEYQFTHLAKLANFSKIKFLVKLVEFFRLQKFIIKMPIPGGRHIIARKSK